MFSILSLSFALLTFSRSSIIISAASVAVALPNDNNRLATVATKHHPLQSPPLSTTARCRRLSYLKEGPPSEINCSLSPQNNYEYYIERCHNATTQWWINGHCIGGEKEEVSELHVCAKSDGTRAYCHDCLVIDNGNDAGGAGSMAKHVCGSDNPNREEVCGIAMASTAKDCGVQRLKAYSYGCIAPSPDLPSSSTSSWYLRESFYCQEETIYNTGPNTFTCGKEWYYPYEPDEHASGVEHPFSNAHTGKYCLDCRRGVQVCAGREEDTCVSLGLLPVDHGGDGGATTLEGLQETQDPNAHCSAWIAHGTLGAIAFGLLVPLSSVTISFSSSYWTHYLHAALNIVTFVMTFCTVGIAITTMNGMGQAGEGHMKEVHHIVGLLLLLFMSFRTANGFQRSYSGSGSQIMMKQEEEMITYEEQGITTTHQSAMNDTLDDTALFARAPPQTLWHLVHNASGLFIFLLGVYEVHSGLGLLAKRYGTPDWGQVYLGYIVWLVTAMVIAKFWMANRGEKMQQLSRSGNGINNHAGINGSRKCDADENEDLMSERFRSSSEMVGLK